MRLLLLFLMAATASALTVLPPQISSDNAVLDIGWRGANPSYPLKLWAVSELGSTNWQFIDQLDSPAVDSDSDNYFEEQYFTAYAHSVGGITVFPGLYDQFTYFHTNIFLTGWGHDMAGNPVFDVGSTNAVTDHQCFFKLSQDIPFTPPSGIWDILTETNIVAGIQGLLSQPKYETAFWSGFGCGLQVLFLMFAILIVRQILDSKEI